MFQWDLDEEGEAGGLSRNKTFQQTDHESYIQTLISVLKDTLESKRCCCLIVAKDISGVAWYLSLSNNN